MRVQPSLACTSLTALDRPGISPSRQPPIETVFLDVGGTLRPNTLTLTPALEGERTMVLSALLGSEPARAATVIEEIETELLMRPGEQPDGVIARVLMQQALEDEYVTAAQVRHALCVDAGGVLAPFEHADELLAGANALGLRCVVLSNTVLRDSEMYHREFTTLGCAGGSMPTSPASTLGSPNPMSASSVQPWTWRDLTPASA